MVTPDRKVRKLMEEYQKTGNVSRAALRADMDRRTARKYLKEGKLPSQVRAERKWRTRPDPFEEHWAAARQMLEAAPELEGKALFEWLGEQHPGAFDEAQLRTFQRRVREWRAMEGPPKEVFFPQEHDPGVRMETDFTWMNVLGITLAGEAFPHLLCHTVLVYSNWESGTVCHSESLLALKKGIQAALFRLGRVPREHWTDHSTAATHAIGSEEEGQREFNRRYLDMMAHFKMTPRTIGVKKPHENGDVESLHGALKRRIKQHLLLRGHRDFNSLEEYEVFLQEIFDKANQLRRKHLEQELAVMRVLDVRKLAEYVEEAPRVSSWSTVQVSGNTYSVPSRLKGEKLRARVYEDHIEIYYHGVLQQSMERLTGEKKHAVNYRHVIDWLVRKPGAFRHYKFRSDMFPTDEFRWAYDALSEATSERVADLEYLRILKHAAHTMECDVCQALRDLRERGLTPRWSAVEELAPGPQPELPQLRALEVNLGDYDGLLGGKEGVA